MKVVPSLLAALIVGLPASEALAQLFRRPVACDSCIAGWYYFDHNASGGWQDWSCSTSSYDGHRGSDFSLAGGIAAIDDGYDVVAAADGTVVAAEDGYYDRCTECGGDRCGTAYAYGFGNHVVANHGAYRVIYAHLRTGSVRVGVGDTVTCGQVVGQIGSSGCSTGAHLHFEVRPLDGEYTTAFDPFEGGCSPTSPSLWVGQGAHRGLPSDECEGPPQPTCPAGTSPIWTCVDDGSARRRCIDGVDELDHCPWGCVSSVAGVDDRCADAPEADAGPDAGADPPDADATGDADDETHLADDGGSWPDGAGVDALPPLRGQCSCRAARTGCAPSTLLGVVVRLLGVW